MQLELQKLINKDKFVVGVYQQHEKGKKVLVNIWRDKENNLKQLTCFLWRKAILKSSKIKIKYRYNYSDKQVLEIVEDFENYDGSITKTFFVFYNVKTNLGYLDLYKL